MCLNFSKFGLGEEEKLIQAIYDHNSTNQWDNLAWLAFFFGNEIDNGINFLMLDKKPITYNVNMGISSDDDPESNVIMIYSDDDSESNVIIISSDDDSESNAIIIPSDNNPEFDNDAQRNQNIADTSIDKNPYPNYYDLLSDICPSISSGLPQAIAFVDDENVRLGRPLIHSVRTFINFMHLKHLISISNLHIISNDILKDVSSLRSVTKPIIHLVDPCDRTPDGADRTLISSMEFYLKHIRMECRVLFIDLRMVTVLYLY
jgi:hypothetical protein